jgi:hypothetical protein
VWFLVQLLGSWIETKKQGHSTFSSSAGPCLCVAVHQTLRPSSPSSIRGAAWRIHIVPASNEGSPRPRCASTGKCQASLPFSSLYSSSLVLEGVAEAALDCAHRTSTVSSCAFCEQGGHLAVFLSHLPLFCTVSVSSRQGTHVAPIAAVERGPSEGARSGSTGATWVSCRSPALDPRSSAPRTISYSYANPLAF